MDVSKDVDLLTEYTQWVSTRKLVASDTSPEEFMRDRLKEVAFDRVQDAIAYLNAEHTHYPDVILAILEGTYDGTNAVREEDTGPAAQKLDERFSEQWVEGPGPTDDRET